MLGLYNKRKQHREAGQAIVILALVMILLLAAIGVAIDGGGLLLLRRQTQNATDAALLAASYAKCVTGTTSESNTAVRKAALDAAKDNGFNNDGVTNWVEVKIPPTSGPTGVVGNSEYIEIIITAVKPKYFIQLVYSGELKVSSRAIGTCKPPSNMTVVNTAITALGNCNNAVKIGGSSLLLDGGASSATEIQSQGSGHTVQNGSLTCSATSGSCGGNNLVIQPPGGATMGAPAPTVPLLFDPNNYLLPNGNRAKAANIVGEYTYHNGNYTYGNGDIVRGLIFVNGNATLNHAKITGPITVVATGTIDVRGLDATLKAGGVIEPYVDNLLFFSLKDYGDPCASQDALKVSGSTNHYWGIFYAPYAAIQISGSDNYLEGAFISQTLDHSGSKNVIIFDPTVLPPNPSTINNVTP